MGKGVEGEDIVENLAKSGSPCLTVPSVARLKMQFEDQMPDKLALHRVAGPRTQVPTPYWTAC